MAEPTGSIIRMPKVENALGQSATSAASQKAVTDGINQAKSAASTADGKAVTAQNTATTAQTTANEAKTAADNAQKTANEAKTAAGTAQTAANNANNNANGRVPSGRKINGMDLTADRNITAAQVGAYNKTETYSRSEMDARYQPKGQSNGVTLGAEEIKWGGFQKYPKKSGEKVGFLLAMHHTFFPEYVSSGGGDGDIEKRWGLTNSVIVDFTTSYQSYGDRQRIGVRYRRITGGI